MKTFLYQRWFFTVALATAAALLTACSTPATKKDDRTGVSIRALNYSAREVAMIAVEEPGDRNSGGGGDALNPYSSGGSICCFALPPKWHPDLKVVVAYQLYPETAYRRVLVNVPPYAEGKLGAIWLIVNEDESAEVVVSEFGPSREEWPGKVKGYPVPSQDYRLKLWREELQREKDDKAAFERDLRREGITASQRKSYQEAIDDINKNIHRIERNRP